MGFMENHEVNKMGIMNFGLVCGILIIGLATYWIHVGRIWKRFGGWFYRSKEPKSFWWEVSMEYLIGIIITLYFLFKIYFIKN